MTFSISQVLEADNAEVADESYILDSDSFVSQYTALAYKITNIVSKLQILASVCVYHMSLEFNYTCPLNQNPNTIHITVNVGKHDLIKMVGVYN